MNLEGLGIVCVPRFGREQIGSTREVVPRVRGSEGRACATAREWRRDWFRDRDLILALDVDHYGWLRESAPDEDARQKVRMLRSFDPAVSDRDALDQGVDDPWYGGHTDFDNSWQLIRAAIPGVVEHVARQLEGRRNSGPGAEGPKVEGERGEGGRVDKMQRVRSIP